VSPPDCKSDLFGVWRCEFLPCAHEKDKEMILTIDYNANSGFVMADGRAEGQVDHLISGFLGQNNDQNIVTSSALIIDFFRLRVAEGIIPTDQIKFTFNGKTLNHNKHGRIEQWPDGYCDIPIGPMEKLLTIGSKSAKDRQKERDEWKKTIL
jgi:hypothetical protein